MIADLFRTAAVKNRVQLLSFIDDFSKTTAGGVAIIMGMTTLKKLALPIEPMQTMTEAAHYGSMAIALGYVFPVAANYIDRALRGVQHDDPMTDMMETFVIPHHLPSRLVGLAAGVALTASLAFNVAGLPGQGDKLHVSPVVEEVRQIAQLAYGPAKSSPTLDIAVSP